MSPRDVSRETGHSVLMRRGTLSTEDDTYSWHLGESYIDDPPEPRFSFHDPVAPRFLISCGRWVRNGVFISNPKEIAALTERYGADPWSYPPGIRI